MYAAHYLTDNGIQMYLRTIDQDKYIEYKKAEIDTESHIKNIIGLVFRFFEIPVEMATVKNRKAGIIRARQFAMYYIRTELGKKAPLSLIGSHFGLDHATVLHHVRKVKGYIECEKDSREFAEHLDKQIRELYN